MLQLVAGVVLCLCPAEFFAQSPGTSTSFSFWYEEWQSGVTISKLQAANVIIGAPSSAVPEIHKNGKHALQYVTYYQSHYKSAFLKDSSDLADVGFQVNGQVEKSVFGGQDNYVLCPNSVELKARVLRYLEGSLKQGFDGYFVDNTFLDPPAHLACGAAHPHIKSGALGGRAYLDLIAAVHQKMKQQNPSAILITNPGAPGWSDKLAAGSPSLWDVSDYVLWESYGYSSEAGPNHDRWKQTIEQSFIYAAQPDKARRILALSYPRSIAEARFAFAVARIFGFPCSANLGEKQQGKDEKGGHFGIFTNDLPADLGAALGSLPDRSSPLLHRSFTNGEIFANSGTTTEHIRVHAGATILLGGVPIKGSASPELELPPMTAAVVLARR
ncbi:MAG TPA: hypothetical protein VGJ33_18805 [Candidatus Angelobacter sp.]